MAHRKTNGENDKVHRIERDFLGEVKVPLDAYFGAHTQRAADNFPISGMRFPRSFIRALGIIKQCAAKVNWRLGLLDQATMGAIVAAAKEVETGDFDEMFVIDIFQSGSATSTNMNANEVIARRGGEIFSGVSLHKNDHVNASQSSNDVIPTAIHMASAFVLVENLLPALRQLQDALVQKATEFADIVKVGRTHLQDAVPITLGQEFSGYARQVEQGIERIQRSLGTLCEVAIGGTAVGTGINSHPEFRSAVVAEISSHTGLPFVPAKNGFEAQASRDALVEMSGQLKTVACSLLKIANDIRWMGSGPRCGIAELFLPEVQPGSSIMPGKVNPVIAESLIMVCVQVIANDTAVTLGGGFGGNFELNTMMPLIAHNILQSASLLSAGSENFARRCVAGIKPNIEQITEYSAANVTICTLLAPKIGYDKAAELVREAYATKTPLRDLILGERLLSASELDQLLSAANLTQPHT